MLVLAKVAKQESTDSQVVVAREDVVGVETHGMLDGIRETRARVPNIHGGKNTQDMSVGAFHTARDPSAHRLCRPAKVVQLATWRH